ncbi:MAG TPA: hypothetical protein VM095_16045 [Pyrinomonadaceae bacterium]|nr:hypothetical protein [Pyrinomonadaceae bacterium]
MIASMPAARDIWQAHTRKGVSRTRQRVGRFLRPGSCFTAMNSLRQPAAISNVAVKNDGPAKYIQKAA